VDAFVVDDITAVPVEQHEYLPMRRGQRATAACDGDQMSAPINVAGQVKIAMAISSPHRAHRATVPHPLPSSDSFMANFLSYHLPSGKVPMSPKP
jgi:hypothetical protein